MHILPVYNLKTKTIELKNQSRRYKNFQNKEKTTLYKKFKNIYTSRNLTCIPKLYNLLIMGTKAPKTNYISYPTSNLTQIHK